MTDQPAPAPVHLAPFTRELLPCFARWMNDFHSDRTQGDLPRPRAAERTERWYARVTTMEDAAWFAIHETATGRPVGLTWLSDIDDRHRTAGFGISIGDPEVRGRGYGTAATRMMLDYAFRARGIRNVQLEVYANNLAGLRAYEKAGFRVIGRRREAYRIAGQVYDEVLMEARAPGTATPSHDLAGRAPLAVSSRHR